MSDQSDELHWRETYFILFPHDRRPTLQQVSDSLAAANGRLLLENPASDDAGLLESLLVESSEDHAAVEFSYEVGEAIVEQNLEWAKQLQEQLHQSEKMEAIGQLAGGIAHDFNNQLSGIMGYADILAGKLTDEKFKGHAEAIVRAAKRSADLIQQLLAFARKGKYLSVPVNLHKLISEVAVLLERSIDKRITIQQILKAGPCLATGDPTQLQNVLLNIAINARDAMPEGGTIIFETAVVTLDAQYCAKHPYDITPGRYVQVCVTDNGVGMDDQTQMHIFEPFFTTKQLGRGTGMGLAAVYGTIKNHHGAINVYSEVGHGTTFKVYLPLAESAAE